MTIGGPSGLGLGMGGSIVSTISAVKARQRLERPDRFAAKRAATL